ncbi:MAG: hypothetical protein WAO02_02055 [Verrucomicrobiia bacterium]
MKRNLMLALVAAVAVMFGNASRAQTPATLTDLLGSSPSPGPNDISQLSLTGVAQPPGLNYYIDNSSPPGQIFQTGSSAGGYSLNSLDVFAAGSGGGLVTSAQFYYLRVYSYNPANSNATLLATYKSQSSFTFFEGDWLEWTGLSVGLSPNSSYAFSFQRGVQGWELMGAVPGDTYTNGQACLIPTAGGTLGTGNFSTAAGEDACMNVGLSLAVFSVNQPTLAPSTVVSTGSVATVTSGVVLGAGSYTYQWQWDAGTGGALVNISGATGSSVTANTAAPGLYQYDVVVTDHDAGPNNGLSITSSVASLTVSYPTAAASLTDVGSAIVPGLYDISQLSGGGTGDGLNYYNNNSDCAGQTFTTGANALGYTLTSLALQTGGGAGSTFNLITTVQPYYLYIYSIDATGSNATLVQEYTNSGFSFATFGDWLQWSGLNVQLAPNHKYAYSFENQAGVTGAAYTYGWTAMNQSTNTPYAGGQLCLILPQGGALYFGNSSTNIYNVPPTNGQSAVFDVGLMANGVVINNPQVTPITGAPLGGAVAGVPITLNEDASGAAPLHYYWFTDGGSGGAISTSTGTDSSNLVLNTTGWLPGAYQFQVVVSNAYPPTATSPPVSVTILEANATAILTDIGLTAPTAGPNDISQFIAPTAANKPDGLNYYLDNSSPPGQTFTTGTSPLGYILNSVALLLAGDSGALPNPTNGQTYDLRIYTVNTNTSVATLYAVYASETNAVIATNGPTADAVDWMQWTGISLPLAANTTYAYTFGRLTSGSGYANLANVTGNPYPDGQVCLVPPYGGAISYSSSGTYDATFDLGLNLGAVKLQIQSVGGGQLKLTWPTGTLLQTTSLGGPWTTNVNTSPYTFTPTGAREFYRVQVP